ncbi:39S ribosomal protein L19, mitochondrial [Orussus abietinus]|uniref:39S ribosomal protein L19, mitochondrial n=1 Tax=Orussus abietinus TaxID=222816 RepID=UPI000625EA74|nr:39S ribosomal protein L19, mitochondrial [Orussus abietinus]
MAVIGRTFYQELRQSLQCLQALRVVAKKIGTAAASESISKDETLSKKERKPLSDLKRAMQEQQFKVPLEYRFVYPEFLPDPNVSYRNHLREKLERRDMLARRKNVPIPEFYVGSILAVQYSDLHAPGKTNRFVGICIQRKGTGLRAQFILRNVVDKEAVEVLYDMYDPAIQQIDCLRLEKRLDEELLYLRDAPLEYSTFPFDMEPEYLPEGAKVPVNDIKIPLNPPPWVMRWERKELKGIQDVMPLISVKRKKKSTIEAKPWERYDLMKIYRETIPQEEQMVIFSEIYSELHALEATQHKIARKRIFVRPKKTG